MIDDEQIHWEEGLYIQPQHFQQLQRHVSRRFGEERRLLTPFSYGAVRVEPDEAALAVTRVQFRRLCVVLKNGLIVDQDHNAIVRPVDLANRRDLAGKITIYLAVRRPQTGVAVAASADRLAGGDGAGANGDDTHAYRLNHHTDVLDENENAASRGAQLTTRIINARLIACRPNEGMPDPATWESLPVLRLIASDPPQIDRQYAPPCFWVGGSNELHDLVVGISQRLTAAHSRIAANAPTLGATLTKGEVEYLLRFQAISKYGAALSHALKADALTPYQAYALCLQCLASMGGVDLREPPVRSNFDHDDPWVCFDRLQRELERFIPTVTLPARPYDMGPLPNFPPAILGCMPDVKLVREGYACTLAVWSDNPEHVDRVVGSGNIVVASPNVLLWADGARFIPWRENPTSGLPTAHRDRDRGSTRFLELAIDVNSPAWQAVIHEGAIGARYADQGIGMRLQLGFKLYLVPPASMNSGDAGQR